MKNLFSFHVKCTLSTPDVRRFKRITTRFIQVRPNTSSIPAATKTKLNPTTSKIPSASFALFASFFSKQVVSFFQTIFFFLNIRYFQVCVCVCVCQARFLFVVIRPECVRAGTFTKRKTKKKRKGKKYFLYFQRISMNANERRESDLR